MFLFLRLSPSLVVSMLSSQFSGQLAHSMAREWLSWQQETHGFRKLQSTPPSSHQSIAEEQCQSWGKNFAKCNLQFNLLPIRGSDPTTNDGRPFVFDTIYLPTEHILSSSHVDGRVGGRCAVLEKHKSTFQFILLESMLIKSCCRESFSITYPPTPILSD